MERLKRVAPCLSGRGAVLLREKDLPQDEYLALARECRKITEPYQVPLIVHTYSEVARELHAPLHLPMPMLHKIAWLPEVWGASVHSAQEAKQAQDAGASYVIAGHIFPTDCKKGVPPRGLPFLKEVVGQVKIPVYAIGGITAENSHEVFRAGAVGACMMSSWMAGDLPSIT